MASQTTPPVKNTVVTEMEGHKKVLIGTGIGAVLGAAYAHHKIGKAKASGHDHKSGYMLPTILGAAAGAIVVMLHDHFSQPKTAVVVAPVPPAPSSDTAASAPEASQFTGMNMAGKYGDDKKMNASGEVEVPRHKMHKGKKYIISPRTGLLVSCSNYPEYCR